MTESTHSADLANGPRSSIQKRFAFYLVTFGVMVVGVSMHLTLDRFKQQIIADSQTHLLSVTTAQQQRISAYIKLLHEKLAPVISNPTLLHTIKKHTQPGQAEIERINTILLDAHQLVQNSGTFTITDMNGNRVTSTKAERDIDNKRHAQRHFKVDLPLMLGQELVGHLYFEGRSTELEAITSNHAGLGESGETILVEKLLNGDAHFLTPLRSENNQYLDITIPAQRTDTPTIRALSGQTGFHQDLTDFREIPVVAVTTQIPETGWGLLIKMDQSELFHAYDSLVVSLVQLLFILALLAIGAAYVMARQLSHPLYDLKEVADKIRRGDYLERADLQSLSLDRETYALALSLNSMADQLLQIFNNSPSGMLIANTDGVIQLCNPALEVMFGYEQGELAGQLVEVLVPEPLRSNHKEYRQRYVDEGMHSRIGGASGFTGCQKSGKTFPIEIEVVPIMTEDGSRQVLASVIDIRDRIAHIREQEVQKEKDNFIATMSHELRTPLSSILGYCDAMMDEITDPVQIENLLHIQSSGLSQLALVNDILDMSKIESGKFSVQNAPYDLTALLKRVENMLMIKAQDAGITLVVDQQNREEFKLIGDEQRVQQVLINLMSNAIKFTPKGKVTVTTKVIHKWLIFTVKDTGIGISPSVMDKLFTRFQQADGSISRRFGGSGLGLFISLNLAEMMGGGIDASSTEGVGSIFELALPYQPSDKPIDTKSRKTAVQTSDIQLGGSVLIAEDTPALQMLERRILEKFGLDVMAANNGVEAVELAGKHHFDLILMDMQMPEMDGIEACRKIRESGDETPVVALTANVMQKHREQFTAAGCNDFLGKPIDKSELQRVLEVYLQ